jgi:hypothetical protein
MSARRVLVRYPSGHRAILVGDFLGPGYTDGSSAGPVWRRIDPAIGWPGDQDDDGKGVAMLVTKDSYINHQRVKANSVVLLDPRAVCDDHDTGERLFAPSLLTAGTCRWVVEWLQENPTWPGRAEKE